MEKKEAFPLKIIMQHIIQHHFFITPIVKALIITNVAIWFFLVVILQGLFLDKPYVFFVLGLSFNQVFSSLWLWQLVTYFFVHAGGMFHIVFNMFALWMFGSELEKFWGSRFFFLFYICCGIVTGLIYLLCLGTGWMFFKIHPSGLLIPMVGASGAIFAILFAYGIIFKERVVYFMMIFPIKAFHFIIIVAMIEFISLINSGIGSPISHLAHLSGFLAGFLFLKVWKWHGDFKFYTWHKWKKFPSYLKIVKNNRHYNKH